MDLLSSKSSKQAFTMVELIAAIAIVAALVAIMVPAIGNFVETSRRTADKQTLAVLNDALNRYKMQGGDISVLTSGASVANVLGYLQNAQAWGGVTHQFLQSGTTYSASSISASGEGVTYQFTAYGSYGLALPSDEDAEYGEVTANMPYGKGVGYVERGSVGTANISAQSSSGYVAYQVDGGSTTIVSSGSAIPVPNGSNAIFWSCAGAADESYSGDITYLNGYNRGIVDANIAGLVGVQTVDLSYGSFTSLSLPAAAGLTRLYLNYSALTSLDLSGCTAIERLYIYGSSNLASLDVSNIPTLEWIKAYDCGLTSIDMSGSSAIVLIELHRNNLTSIDLSDQVNLIEFTCPDNNISGSLDFSMSTAMTTIDITGNNVSSITLGSKPTLYYLSFLNNNIGTLDVSGCTQLGSVAYYGNPITSSGTALNNFYNSLSAPGPYGGGRLFEVEGATGSDSGNGNTSLVPSGWIFY